MAVVKPPYREQVVTFGAAGGLVGIATLPVEPRADAPHLVLINPGIIHRVGASRLYVAVARALAASGVTTLRFDLSGIGDSERAAGAVSLSESVHADVAAAVDLMTTRYGAEGVAVGGLCSGAFDAFEYALRDPRVGAVAMIDMPGPFQHWTHVVHYVAPRLFSAECWRVPLKKLKRVWGAFAGAREADVPPAGEAGAPAIGVRSRRAREQMTAELDALLSRGVRLSFVFTGGLPELYNHEAQFRHVFPRAARHPLLTVDYLAACDHIFSKRTHRAEMIARMRTWVLAAAGAAARGRESPVPTATPEAGIGLRASTHRGATPGDDGAMTAGGL